jgi:hypothetical protein
MKKEISSQQKQTDRKKKTNEGKTNRDEKYFE